MKAYKSSRLEEDCILGLLNQYFKFTIQNIQVVITN